MNKDRIDEIKSIFDEYFTYVGLSEAPRIYHRWGFLTGVAALIGRETFIPFGHGKIHANMYTILIGAAGTRKSTAISQVKNILRAVGYENFAADRTSKEKFIADLQTLNSKQDDTLDLMGMEVEELDKRPAEILVTADELQDFFGQNNIDYITMLGVLWDCKDIYEHRVKHGKNSVVYKPYVSILGGSTQVGFALAFPPEIVTQGFLSRLIMIYGERTVNRIAWPEPPNTAVVDRLENRLVIIKEQDLGAVKVANCAKEIAAKIYNTQYSLQDPRFESYEQRRYTHMLKLALICARLRLDDTIYKEDILIANTLLHHAEKKMPHALGEFGKSKYADVATLIIDYLQRTPEPMDIMDLWKVVANDLPSQKDLVNILHSLVAVNKIKAISTSSGVMYVLQHKNIKFKDELLIPDLLNEQELNYEI